MHHSAIGLWNLNLYPVREMRTTYRSLVESLPSARDFVCISRLRARGTVAARPMTQLRLQRKWLFLRKECHARIISWNAQSQ